MIRIGKRAISLNKILGFKHRSTPKGCTPMEHTRPEDVFIVGYPKSGHTWFQNLVAGIVYGMDPSISPPLLANDLVPDVHFNEFYRRYSTPMFFKSHALPRPEYRRVVYLLRDGRDAMVSFLHYVEAIERKKLDFLEFVTEQKRYASAKWHEHVEAWAKNPFGAHILTIKYEDLLEQPVEQLERFCQFLNLPRKRDVLAAVAEAAQFRNLRDKEARLGWGWPDRWPTDKFFFRRGVAGSHKDEMPPAVLTAFLKEAGETLQRLGYSVNPPAKEHSRQASEPVVESDYAPSMKASA
jgi:hypothetical protein